jgi:hypothetical protein
VGIIVEFLHLWEVLDDFLLQPEVEDSHSWRLASNKLYSAKSCYESLFLGAISFKPCERIWRTWVPPKCKLFLWLAAHKRCWTLDRLARRGLPHPEQCPLCDQEDENIDHILVSCVFSRQFWYLLLRQVGLHVLAPQPTESSFDEWWERAGMTTSGLNKRGLNSLIVLGAWTIWKHRNRCVFDGINPNMAEVLALAGKSTGNGCWPEREGCLT